RSPRSAPRRTGGVPRPAPPARSPPAGRPPRGGGGLEAPSTALFILLMVVFCALVCWMALSRQMVLRVFAACLAFIPAMLFGVAAVNKYYDYYQTWGAVASDLGGQGAR